MKERYDNSYGPSRIQQLDARPFLCRFTNVTHWVATLVVAAGDLGTRGKVLSKLIELADVLSDKLGNLVAFMAIMEGLALPQVLL